MIPRLTSRHSPSWDTRSIDRGAINAAVHLAPDPGVLRSLASAVQAAGGTSTGPSSAVARGSGTDGKLSVVLLYHDIMSCWPILLTRGYPGFS